MSHSHFIRLPEVQARTGLKKSTIYAAIKAKTFPSQVSLGGRAVGFLSSDIDAWIEARIAASELKRK